MVTLANAVAHKGEAEAEARRKMVEAENALALKFVLRDVALKAHRVDARARARAHGAREGHPRDQGAPDGGLGGGQGNGADGTSPALGAMSPDPEVGPRSGGGVSAPARAHELRARSTRPSSARKRPPSASSAPSSRQQSTKRTSLSSSRSPSPLRIAARAIATAIMTVGPAMAAKALDPPSAPSEQDDAALAVQKTIADKLDAILSELKKK
jgi:hypothetical protein